MTKRKEKYQKGFTLIELLTAVSVFTVIMVISMGSILGIFDANRKSRSMKTVMNNLNLALESMSKEIRFGDTYHCGGGNYAAPANCAAGASTFSFLSGDGTRITYTFSNGVVYKEVGGNGTPVAVTAPEVVIDDIGFYVFGAGTGDTLSPKVIIKLEAHAGQGRGRTDFTLQTLASQREPDI